MEEKEQDTIQHLVISGGGTYGLAVYGALKHLHLNGVWNLSNIKSCHGTSIGSILLVMIIFGYDWETLDDYLIKRPWENVFKIDWTKLLDMIDNCGVFEKKVYIHAFEPLFKGMDVDANITLSEFYKKTNIEFYVYASEINKFKLECFSYKTHPNMKVIEACYASCSIPLLFKPLTIDDKTYMDGGLFLNYPAKACIEKMGAKPNQILGFRKIIINDYSDRLIDDSSNMIDYIMVVIKSIVKHVNQDLNENDNEIPNELTFHMEHFDLTSLKYFLQSQENRISLINKGIDNAKQFLEKGNLPK